MGDVFNDHAPHLRDGITENDGMSDSGSVKRISPVRPFADLPGSLLVVDQRVSGASVVRLKSRLLSRYKKYHLGEVLYVRRPTSLAMEAWAYREPLVNAHFSQTGFTNDSFREFANSSTECPSCLKRNGLDTPLGAHNQHVS